jgi:hypothetical protein
MVPKSFKGLATQGRDRDVHPLMPRRRTLGCMPPVHDPVDDADLGQGLSSFQRLVSLVGQHGLLVAADQGVGSDGLPDVGAENRIALRIRSLP